MHPNTPTPLTTSFQDKGRRDIHLARKVFKGAIGELNLVHLVNDGGQTNKFFIREQSKEFKSTFPGMFHIHGAYIRAFSVAQDNVHHLLQLVHCSERKRVMACRVVKEIFSAHTHTVHNVFKFSNVARS